MTLAVFVLIAGNWSFWRLARAGIVASGEGIYVANFASSFNLRWEEIERFDIGRWSFLPYVCLIHLRDGEVRHAFGIEESTQRPNGSAEEIIEELNNELARRLPDRPTPIASGRPGSAQSKLFERSEGR